MGYHAGRYLAWLYLGRRHATYIMPPPHNSHNVAGYFLISRHGQVDSPASASRLDLGGPMVITRSDWCTHEPGNVMLRYMTSSSLWWVVSILHLQLVYITLYGIVRVSPRHKNKPIQLQCVFEASVLLRRPFIVDMSPEWHSVALATRSKAVYPQHYHKFSSEIPIQATSITSYMRSEPLHQ